jgi:hypothetical protein
MQEHATTIGCGLGGARALRTVAALLAALGWLAGAPAGAAVPSLIGYQGTVFDAAGNPAAGPVTIGVALYGAESGGAQLYAETHAGVELVDGVFDLQIGAGANAVGRLDATTVSGPVWLELTIDGERLDPRQRLVAVPYALRAAVAESLDGALGTVPRALSADRLSSTFGSTGSGISLGVNLGSNGSALEVVVRFGFVNDFFAAGKDAYVFE